MSTFKKISPKEVTQNPFALIGDEWMLVAAEKEGKVNAMTAAWGGLGFMWNKQVAFIVIRPQRYTKEFVDSAGRFSLTFFGSDYRKMLGYMGSVSGRDEDKIEKSGLTVAHEDGVPYFAEAEMVFICRNIYAQEYKQECFIDSEPDKRWHPEKDYHMMYIAEIETVLVKE